MENSVEFHISLGVSILTLCIRVRELHSILVYKTCIGSIDWHGPCKYNLCCSLQKIPQYTYVYFTFEESTINVIPSSNIFMQVARKYILTHAPTQEI